ncbi:DUF1998 domain-containing protein [Brachybacterium halotolerans subsp. kimchii]|uniref:DUF1998 domain-containing protein n=1 Tax=Brachybacterium halotolerans TaxID=2795215 RepID=UPI001E4D3D60|nr:DUF1998 domain-containing protein [Brachybacterium halotolerans]UEJ81851.1 DUF1998 domain-containing protein [Brachybacterium halotolerans subsp. kimchii]
MTDLDAQGESGLDPLGDAERWKSKNYARVGSARPSSLLYSYGPGAAMDLPRFTVMPSGFDDWNRVWKVREGEPETIHAPRLLRAIQNYFMGDSVRELRPFPWAPKTSWGDTSGSDLGVPCRVFPQWMRCTGCDKLAPIVHFTYRNTNPFRPDLARFMHEGCPGHGNRRSSRTSRTTRAADVVPARYLLACPNGHLDEFPYEWWVHKGGHCADAETPLLTMTERNVGKGSTATIHCQSCGASRPMNEAQGETGRTKLPRCRGRHPHLARFDPNGCDAEARLMLLGASNLWFPATQSIIVMPGAEAPTPRSNGFQILETIGERRFAAYKGDLAKIREELELSDSGLADLSNDALEAAIAAVDADEEDPDQHRQALESFDPISLLEPEWHYLARPLDKPRVPDTQSGLVLSRPAGGVDERLKELGITQVHTVDKLRKVNALVGFTRIDDMERAEGLEHRLAPLTRSRRPSWTVATEDRGEGMFIQFDEEQINKWERKIYDSDIFKAHIAAHERNYLARLSDTAKAEDHLKRFEPPRYWLLHTLSHILIREMAMASGYSAASISERIYAWPEEDERPPAAGILLITTASDSDGTLGGLVQQSTRRELGRTFSTALRKAQRCSSDPVCAHRTPQDPEDFLHGAACHTCAMASETSCERANRFLDRRFLVDLPGFSGYGFFDRDW